MFCSTGTHKVRCNGADTKRRWWIEAADHTTKSSKLLSQYMNCFSFALDKLNHCLALTGMSLKKLSPATLQNFTGLTVTCRDGEQRGAVLLRGTYETFPCLPRSQAEVEPLRPTQENQKAVLQKDQLSYILNSRFFLSYWLTGEFWNKWDILISHSRIG